jgi:hypothetical protein
LPDAVRTATIAAREDRNMQEFADLDRYPLDRPDSPEWGDLVARSRATLAADGMFNLEGFLRADALARAVAEVTPVLTDHAFRHARRHNVYFLPEVPGLASDHPALAEFETVNNTICTDQLAGMIVRQLYEWEPFARFLAAVMDKPALYRMDDPLSGVNVMAYQAGEALNWHFDRSEFTTTLLLQAPEAGGAFEYRSDLRSGDDPNHDGVARMLAGGDPRVKSMSVPSGTLNVFRGVNTIHRITPVAGVRPRIVTVFCFYERPGACFSHTDRIGFYGRTGESA